MARTRQPASGRSRRRPATSPEEREMQLADAAYDLAEEQITSGVASSQVITHFLKVGSTRERLEQQRIYYENEMLVAKKQQLEGQQRVEALFADAIQAFRGYSGLPPGDDGDGEFVEG